MTHSLRTSTKLCHVQNLMFHILCVLETKSIVDVHFFILPLYAPVFSTENYPQRRDFIYFKGN